MRLRRRPHHRSPWATEYDRLDRLARRSPYGPVRVWGYRLPASRVGNGHRWPWWWRLWRRITAPFLLTVFTALILPWSAQADPLDDYTVITAPNVCTALDTYPTFEGVWAVTAVIVNDGHTAGDAGEVIARSVIGWCPTHLELLQQFLDELSGNTKKRAV